MILRRILLATLFATTSTTSALAQDDLLSGLFVPSDQAFDGFISPMTNPVFFEDPRTLTEARFIFLNHHLPNNLGGDNVQLYALQLRAALTDNLSLIATKDGFIVSQSDVLDDGWADVALGLKYNLYKNADTQTILSGGFTFELPVGSTKALQGNGDGEWNIFATAGQEFWDTWHFVSCTGFRLPSNRAQENQVWYWSNHLDTQVFDSPFYVFTECNWFHYMSSADEFPPIGGHDLFNFGSAGITGENLVTGSYGLKYSPSQALEVGVAYEIPYSDRRDVIQDRLTFDLIVRY